MNLSSNKFVSLFGSVFFLFSGYGLFLNSAAVKLAEMGVSSITIGILNAAFFGGATFSAVAAHRIVSRVGHIRGFGVFVAIFAMASLAHVMLEQLWILGVLRFSLGFCYFSLLMVVESWFTERSSPQSRAKVLAIYNIVYYVSFTIGLALLSFKMSSNDVFSLAAILVMAAMLPVALTKLPEPDIPPRQRISLPHLLSVAPLALVGSFLGGLMVNGFFTMSSVFLLQQGLSLKQISLYLSLSMFGGFIVQIPIARFSNRYGRRTAILFCSILATLTAMGALTTVYLQIESLLPQYIEAFLFGFSLFTLYSLSLARANDVLPKNMNTVEVSRSILFTYGLGSLVAPILLGSVMEHAHDYGFYSVYLFSALFLAFFAWRQRVIPEDERSIYVAVTGDGGPAIVELDPRIDETTQQPFDVVTAQSHVENSIHELQESGK